MIKHNLDELILSSQKILLLQGPIGKFFLELSHWLQKQNKQVFKINFNSGDEYFYPNGEQNTFAYTDNVEQFAAYLQHLCITQQIDTLVCFGDNRPYHKIAKTLADTLKLNFWVFEEGYFRPDYITLEKSGVNAFSLVPKSADYFFNIQEQLATPFKPKPLASGFLRMAKLAMLYYGVANLFPKEYKQYEHHRVLKIGHYIKLWTISGIKRFYYHLHDKSFAKRVKQGEFGDFFIVPLQVYNDSQILVHSDYEQVADFLREVLDSFQMYAPNHLRLIIKHHPMDRGFIDYQQVIDEYITSNPSLKNRLYYVHDVPMPVFLRHGKGMVTLNSTSGISALLHDMPVKTLGRANYDFEGLTHQGDLKTFWQHPIKPNAHLFEIYRQFHLNRTQINGSFYYKAILNVPRLNE